MEPKSLFKLLISGMILFMIISIIAGETLRSTLPVPLREYLQQKDQLARQSFTASDAILGIIGLGILIILIVSLVGLWKFKPRGRTLYVGLTVVTLPFYVLTDPTVATQWEMMFGMLSTTFHGMIIAMMFTDPLRQEFEKNRKKPAKIPFPEEAKI